VVVVVVVVVIAMTTISRLLTHDAAVWPTARAPR
jgi:hypothetical protein